MTVLGALALLGGCGDGPAPPHEGPQVLEPTLVAQSADGVEFSRMTAIAVDSRGEIYVGDSYGEVFVLRPDGSLARRIGGSGHGPGEFQAVSSLQLLDGDSLYVYDAFAFRATVFQPRSGRIAYTTRLPAPDFSFPMEIKPHGAATLIGHFRRINGELPIAGQRHDDVIRILGRDGSVVRDTLMTVQEPEIVTLQTSTTTGFYSAPFSRQTLVQWDRQGRVYSLWTDSSRVRIQGTDGAEHGAFTADLGIARIPLAARTIDSVAAANVPDATARRELADAFRARWQTWPLVEDMLIDDKSRIWILPVMHSPTVSWIAFDARGRRLASFTLPHSVRPRLIQGDRVYAIHRDSLDVETLAVYRLAPSSARTPDAP